MPFVYAFDRKHRKPPMGLKDLLGGKGANLAEMTSVLGLPVPPGFTISTDACRAYIEQRVARRPHGGDQEGGRPSWRRPGARSSGDPSDPLLVSVRSGAKFSMPGMMDTVLNLGLNDESVKGLAAQMSDERFAYDSYRRFVSMYGRIVLGIDGERFDKPFDEAKDKAGVDTDAEIPASVLVDLVDAYKAVVAEATGQPFPQDPQDQLQGAIEAVFSSWNGARAVAYRVRERIPHALGTAVNVQSMVFGNRNDDSGTGVGFTRDPATGAQGSYGDFLVNAQGEDVVAGIRNTLPLADMDQKFPKIYKQLMDIFARLESHYRDMCDTEFTIEDGELFMLQTRVGKRTGAAALRMAVDMTKQRKWKITREEAVGRVTADHLDQVLHPQFDAKAKYEVLVKGLAASPGAAVGKVYFSATKAADAAARGRADHPGSGRDVPRGRARHDRLRGHPHQPGRPGQPRRRRRPRLGQAGGGRGREGPHQQGQLHGRRRARRRRRCHLPRRHQRHRGGRRGPACRWVSRPRSSRPSSGGPTRSARASWRCAPMPTTDRTRPTPASSAPRASGCAAPSTCSWPRTASPSCGA